MTTRLEDLESVYAAAQKYIDFVHDDVRTILRGAARARLAETLEIAEANAARRALYASCAIPASVLQKDLEGVTAANVAAQTPVCPVCQGQRRVVWDVCRWSPRSYKPGMPDAPCPNCWVKADGAVREGGEGR